jgi:hypothetical protein
MRQTPFVLALLAFTSAHAQWIDKQGNRLADTDDENSIGSFGAEIVSTKNDEVVEARINKPSYAFVVFGGCKPSVAGKCNVSMSFRVDLDQMR